MGLVKAMGEEQDDAGFSYWDNERVCSSCVVDGVLAAWVAGAGSAGVCSFCGTQQHHVVLVHDLFVEMGTCIQSEYTTNVTMDGPVPTLDSNDLLYNLGEPLGEGRLREVFIEAFLTEWAERDYWVGSYDDRLLLGWEQFVELVKRHSRFVFFHPKAPRPADLEPADMPGGVLDVIGDAITKSGLVIPLPAGQTVYRGRRHHPGQPLTSPAELGAPPPQLAGSQRMNPAGISYFYAAVDEATCLAELRGTEGDTATVATWITRRDSYIVDFVRLPEIPSIFDHEPAHNRSALRFLFRFAREIAKPLKPHDDPAVDYVPTQILSEYIRHCVQNWAGEPVEGVMYPSAARPNGTNVVFFVDNFDHHEARGLLKMYGEPQRHVAIEATTRWQAIEGPETAP